MRREQQEPREPVTVNVRPSLKQAIERRAAADGRSTSNFIERLLEQGVAAERGDHEVRT